MLSQFIPHVHPVHRQRIRKFHHVVVHVTLFTIYTRTVTAVEIRFFSTVIHLSYFFDDIIVPTFTFDLKNKILQVFNKTTHKTITPTCCDDTEGTTVIMEIGVATRVSVDAGDEHVDA